MDSDTLNNPQIFIHLYHYCLLSFENSYCNFNLDFFCVVRSGVVDGSRI